MLPRGQYQLDQLRVLAVMVGLVVLVVLMLLLMIQPQPRLRTHSNICGTTFRNLEFVSEGQSASKAINAGLCQVRTVQA